MTVAKFVQLEAFPEELRCLHDRRSLPRKSKLIALNPFIDEEGLIRVGGRIRHAKIALC